MPRGAIKGHIISDETKRKISHSLKGNKYTNKGQFKKGHLSFKGKLHTPESNQKNRLAHLGKIPWNLIQSRPDNRNVDSIQDWNGALS